ncbi:transporter substrate-binding domain-containing protein [Microvirga zambiensis]|uniref:transporter substrate-binding domain-containing protein n=1 Tax=Microvirga zambiensis TaxID=1402137 RepID=UPI00191D861F|nr:transporter substrate-binding domain-containing protein [Microvirga zambiensis]
MAQQDNDLDLLRQELAPSGTLRCALNHGNVVLVRRGLSEDTPSGVSVDLARELARRLDLPIEFRHYDKAEAVSDGAGSGEWDICFLAIDPKRAEQIAYSDPYVLIEGAYLLRRGSAARTPSDVDVQQLKIGVVKGSAYELHLTRTGQGGKLIRFSSFGDAVSSLDAGELDGLGGVRQAMQKVAVEHPGFEVMAEPFMAIPQAMGVSVLKPTAARFVRTFVKEMKASGMVSRSLAANGHADVTVPAA